MALRPWLFLPVKLAHDLAPYGLQFISAFRERRAYAWRSFEWRGLQFANPLGLAGGVDKDASSVEAWWTFGPGFVEIGTVTPKPQGPNPGKIIARSLQQEALWNRMGFPGEGAHSVRENLRDLPRPRTTPLFVNIGKNRETPNEAAARDYAECIAILKDLADAYVVNISSPNTSGLRDLFQPAQLHRFLGAVVSARDCHAAGVPLLLKLSPDLEDSDLKIVIDTACAVRIDGFIATNTTLARDAGSPFPSEGGVSGRPLATRSVAALQKLVTHLGDRRVGKLVVSAGGVMTAEDVLARLKLGADLVQVYTVLVFEGPGFFRRVAAAVSLDPRATLPAAQ